MRRKVKSVGDLFDQGEKAIFRVLWISNPENKKDRFKFKKVKSFPYMRLNSLLLVMPIWCYIDELKISVMMIGRLLMQTCEPEARGLTTLLNLSSTH